MARRQPAQQVRAVGEVGLCVAASTLLGDAVEFVGKSALHSAHVLGVVDHLPDIGEHVRDVGFDLIEPLRELFKDEVRRLGLELGLPEALVHRHPFPGPGLAVRTLGEVTAERLHVLRQADAILLEELKASGWYRQTSQAFAVLLPVHPVGVMGDERTYGYPIIIRAVTSEDAMTADWARLPYDLLERMSSRIINEVDGVNRVAYDITSKPPGTIEWE